MITQLPPFWDCGIFCLLACLLGCALLAFMAVITSRSQDTVDRLPRPVPPPEDIDEQHRNRLIAEHLEAGDVR